MEIGDLFQVKQTVDHFDDEIILSRYTPGIGYRVTERNHDFVADQVANGNAFPFDPRVSRRAEVTGTAQTRPNRRPSS